jgi:hypothetical protein
VFWRHIYIQVSTYDHFEVIEASGLRDFGSLESRVTIYHSPGSSTYRFDVHVTALISDQLLLRVLRDLRSTETNRSATHVYKTYY